ncbi:MAG: hypothetical protein IKG99_01985 [Bacteroidaceae bacterium]|nr:hypothetical protein [Bacteroidaceae bacterium]
MKRHLLFALAMLFATVGFAQKDITSQYITNAKLDQGTVQVINGTTTRTLDGWTVKNFNNSQQGNNTQGWASESYAGWGNLDITEYSLTQNITLPAGHYTLVNYSFFRYGLDFNTDPSKSLAYLKAGDNQVLVKTLGSITANGYANSQAEGANAFDSKMYRNTVDFTIDADGTQIEIGLVGTFDLKQSWMICGMFELIDNDQLATMDSPFDVTGYITNPGFEYRDMTGWTVSPAGYFGTQNNNQSFKVGGHYAEKWQASGALPEGSMSQTLTGLPAGFYKLTVNLGGNGTYVDLNGKTAEWTADKDYTVGYVLAENEDLVITAGKTAEGTANWIHFDNFRLHFCGDVAAALTTLCEKVTEYEGKIPSTAYSNLQTEVNAKNQTYSDVDELLAAIDDVQELYDAADLLVAPYAAWNEAYGKATELPVGLVVPIHTEAEAATTAAAIEAATAKLIAFEEAYSDWREMYAYAEALVDVANDNEDANNTLGSAINEQYEAMENATSAETVTSATAALKEAMVTYAGVANPTSEDEPFDLTFMLTNPDLTPYWDGTWWIQPEGWFTDQEGGNFQVMNNGSVNATTGEDIFMEYYYLNNGTTWGNNQFNIYTMANLAEGTYKMSCFAFAKEENYTSGNPKGAVYFYANDTQGSCVTSNILAPQSIEFVQESEGEVKIGLKPQEGNTYNWMGIGYVQLFKVPAKAFVIDEAVAYDNTQEGAGDVILTRTIKEGMNTVVLPFQMTAADIEILGGEGAVARTVSEFLPASEDFSFAEVTEVAPNQPFFLYATVASADREDGNVFTFKGKTLVAGEPKAEVGDLFTLVGTYAVTAEVPVSTPEKRNFILNGGKLYNVDSEGVSIHNTRCYIEINIPSIAINEGETFENTQTYKYANVTLTRTIKEGMNTVVVPFELTAEDIAAIGGEGAVAYTVSGYANDNLKFATAETVAANIPFFLNATEATSGAGEFAFEGKKVVAGDPIVKVSADCSLVGTYETTPVPVSGDNGSYYILSGGKFYTVNSEVNIKNTRFYVATSAPAGANTLGFTFDDGEANAINGIIANDNAPEGIYNLQGQKVEKATKGIYIINGKKVLVK